MSSPGIRPAPSLRRRMLLSGAAGSLLAVAGVAVLLGLSARLRGQLSSAIDAWAEEQLIADRISGAVMRQFLAVTSVRRTPGGTAPPDFTAAGRIVYEQLQLYLFRDLSPAERLQLEVVKEAHQRLEVAASRSAAFFARGDPGAGEASLAAMSTHGLALLEGLEGFLRMREADLHRLRQAQQRASRAMYAVGGVFGIILLLGAAGFGRFLLRRVDRPLAQLADAARRLERGDLTSRVSEDHDEEFATLAATFNQMAESLAAALAATRRSEESFRHLFSNNPLPMWVYDRETTRFLEVNDAAVGHYGYSREEFLAMRLADIRPPEDVPRLEAQLARELPQVPAPGEWRHRLKDGRIIHVEITSRSLAFGGRPSKLVVAHDITKGRQVEDQLRQAQKMEAVGRLTGGIAHDFNNLLTVILSNAAFVLERIGEAHPARQDVTELYEAGQRAALLTRQLLAFSRKQVLDPKVTNLNGVLDGLEPMLRRLLGEDIEIEFRRSDALGNVLADPGQLDQVILNLAINARDAMPEGGKLTFETGNVDLDEAYVEQHAGVVPGRYVRLSVTDTGIGMSPETMRQVFEPFFTTKEKGEGTGLGLSTAYGVVKQSGGNIWVYSELGKGTTFKIYLPRVDAPLPAPRAAPQGGPAAGRRTILVVEDEAAVRRTAVRILEREGYTVLSAESGAEALRLCQAHEGPIDLLLTDVVMPLMSGRELEQRLRARRPGLKVLFASGYADDAIVRHGVLEPGTQFISKPFTLEELARKVRAVLDEG